MNLSQPASSPAPGRAVAWLIGLVPVVMVLTSWDDKLSPLQTVSRFMFMPMLAAEVTVILLLLRDAVRRIAGAPPLVRAGLLALLAVAWNTAIGSGSTYSLIQTTTWMIHLLFGVSIAALAARDEQFAGHIVKAVPAGFLLFAFLFLLYIATRYDPARNWVNDIPAYANVRWFGFYAETVFAFCAWGWLRGRPGSALIAILALAMAMWTGARAPLAAVAGGYVVACAIFPFLRGGWRRFTAIVLLAVLLAIVAGWLVPLGAQGPQRLANDMGDSGRLDLWMQSLGFIAERPWFGWGEGRFMELSGAIVMHPHNVVLQVLLAWGLVGALLVAALLGWFAYRIHRVAKDEDAPFLLAVLILAAASLVDGVLYLNQSVALFATGFAILAARAASRGAAEASAAGSASPTPFAGALA